MKPPLARSISRSVWERCQTQTFAGQVLAIFAWVCYLTSPDSDVVALVLPDVDNGPLNIVVAGEPGLFAALEPGMPAYLDANQVRVGRLAIDLGSAVPWEPQPAWDRLQTCRQGIAEHLPLLQAFALHHAPEGSLLTNQAIKVSVAGLQAGWNGDPIQLQAVATRLAGLGSGLTPAGDDFLVGVMLSAWLTHPSPQLLCQILLETAAPRTTTLSAAFLRAAARGECGPPWHTLLAALAEGADADLLQAVRGVLAYGHTSGADTLAGFLWTGFTAASPQG